MKNWKTFLMLLITSTFSCKPANLSSNVGPKVDQDPIEERSPVASKLPKIKIISMSSAWWKNCMSIILNGDERNRVSVGCNTEQTKIGSEIDFKGYDEKKCNQIRIILDVDSSDGSCGGEGCKDSNKRMEANKPIWTRSTGLPSDKRFFKVFSPARSWETDKEFVVVPEMESFLGRVSNEMKGLANNEQYFLVGAEDQPRTRIEDWDKLDSSSRTSQTAKEMGLDWNDFVIAIRGKNLSIENFSGGCQ